MAEIALLLLALVAQGAVEIINAAINAVVQRGNEQMVGCRLNEQGTLDALQTATAQSQQAIGKVHLGDHIDTVLSILSGSQNLPEPYYYLENGTKLIEIYTIRTNVVMLDGCTTDDEVTPFIFRDGILVSIGWRTLSGPHSFGTPRIDNSQGNSDSAPR